MWTLLLAAIGVPIDCLIKYKVEHSLEEQEKRPVFGGFITLRNYHNRGAMLELGRKKSRLVMWVSSAITALIAGIYLAVLIRGEGSVQVKAALALVAGGGLSNSMDRLAKGYVVDYISFGRNRKKRTQVVYNLSDFCIFAGALLLALEEVKRL